MLLTLKQQKLEELLEKLSLGGAFPSSILAVKMDEKKKKPVMFSIQREVAGQALRYLKVNDSFFETFEEPTEQEAIEIDIPKVMGAVKKIRPGTLLTLTTEGNKLKITGVYEDKDYNGKIIKKRHISPLITFKTPESIDTKLPMTFDKGTPIVGKKKVSLDVGFSIKLSDLKDATEYASVMKTEFYNFAINKDGLTMRIGDLYDFSDYWEYQPRYEHKEGQQDLSLILTFGLKEIASTFRHDAVIRTVSNAPAWIYEKTDDYTLGVLIPPHIPSKDEAVA